MICIASFILLLFLLYEVFSNLSFSAFMGKLAAIPVYEYQIFSRGLNLLACCGKETTLYSHSYEKLVAPKIPLGRKKFFSYVCRIVHPCKKLNSVLLNIILLFLLNNVLNAPTFIIAFMPHFFLFSINRV